MLVKSLGARIWVSAIFIGLVGQIAWVIENMYFATLAQDIFSNSGRNDLSYLVTTLMVIFSAICATATTIVAGALSDKAKKRKPFIAIGYIVWGVTIMLFALLPMKPEAKMIGLIATLLVVFDCIMTLAGSTANDAAFNAWVIDNTPSEKRGKMNSILAILPVIAVVIVFIGLGGLYNSNNDSNALFFIVLGVIPMVCGIISIFLLKDSNSIEASEVKGFKDFFYGFRLSIIKSNKMLYITLICACLVGIAQQTFFSYLINFLQNTLELHEGFVIPMAVIIVGSAIVTGVFGFMFDKFGRKRFYIPLLIMAILGILSFFMIQYTSGAIWYIFLYLGGILMMGGILSLTGIFTSTFQDYVPKGTEGRFQGVRMCFMVLVPMIIGPIVSLILGLNAMGMNGENFTPPYSLFLAAAIIAVITFLPLIFVRGDSNRLRSEKNEAQL